MSGNSINLNTAPPPVSTRKSSSGVSALRESAVATTSSVPPAASQGNLQSTDSPAVSRSLEEPDLSQAVDQLNGLAQTIRRELQFTVDDDSGRTVIKVFDTETEQLIRQIPPDEVLSLIARMQDLESGLLQEHA